MYRCFVNKAHQLQTKAASLPEHLAAEVLDFLDSVSMRRAQEEIPTGKMINRCRGAFKGRLSSTDEFANRKSDEIRLEE